MLPAIPQLANSLVQDPQGKLNMFPFPPNAAVDIPREMRQQIYRWMLINYFWPQIQERKQFEDQWDKLRDMAKATWKYDDIKVDPSTRLKRKAQEKALKDSDTPLQRRIEVSDTVIFDAVDRLTNLNHFVSFKQSLPVQFNTPEDVICAYENEFYTPHADLIRSANGWLKFNATNQKVYQKHWLTAKHHYTYGMSFVCSEFEQKVEAIPRLQPDNTFKDEFELTKIGITFEPISIRKLWLNYRLPISSIEYQQCPFWFELMPRFAILANPYDKDKNPMGFANLNTLPKPQYLLAQEETNALYKQWQSVYPEEVLSLGQLLGPEFNVELLWNAYPMLPLALDQSTGKYVFDADGSKGIPYSRFIVRLFGNNLVNGNQEIISLQPNFYPEEGFPLYGSAHMPSLDDGVYSSAIGTVLEGHYKQLCKCLEQAIDNKDWINDPPVMTVIGSPSMSKDINAKGAKLPVNSPSDLTRREPYDATQTTPAIMNMVRNQAQTSSKVVDAILGKAMGSRTTASEAQNVFQTAMAGVTTDINLFDMDIMGGWATRVWSYTGRWVHPQILAAITGFYGYALKPQDLKIRLGIKCDSGSQFIEQITREQNIQYLLQTCPPGDPEVNRPYLIRELLTLWRFPNVDKIVNDGGREDQIQLSTQQAIETYLGLMVMVDPSQDHQIGLSVKTSFLKDRESVWNTDPRYAPYGPRLVQQIQQHQLFLQLQMLQQQLQMQKQQLQQSAPNEPLNLQSLQNNNNNPSPGAMPSDPGQARSKTGS